MTERQKKLISDYGPGFYVRATKIKDQFLYLSSEAASLMTDKELKGLDDAIATVVKELNTAQEIVHIRMKEAGLPVR